MLIGNDPRSMILNTPQRTTTHTPVKNDQPIERDDIALEGFREALKEGGGTGSSLQRINLEKIEQAIEEKRLELEAKYGVNAKPPLSPEAQSQAMGAIEKELADFMKQFLENLALKDGIQKEPGGPLPRGMLLSMMG